MRIDIPDNLMAKLEAWCATAKGREVSGLGTVEVVNDNFYIKEVFLLDAGSEGFTEIPPERIAELYATGVDPSKVKLWWHRHPIGDGVPGQQNWSGLDEKTATVNPLGSSPQAVKWSIAIVRTPYGWVGRVDHHVKQKTVHLEVSQAVPYEDHEKIHTYLQGASVRSVAPKVHVPMVTQKEKFNIVDAACHLFGGKVHRGTQRKNWLHRKLSFYQIGEDKYQEAKDLLDKLDPEDVERMIGIDLFTLRDLDLISWNEMEDAMVRKYDREHRDDWRKNQFSYWES